jgi:hypothetical protein
MTVPFRFDTLSFVKRLAAAGMDVRQAEAFAEALGGNVFENIVTESMLRAELKDLELRLILRTGAMIAASTALTVAILGGLITLS